VTVVSLVASTDVAQVVSTVAYAIGVREHDSRPLRERFLAELGSVRRLVLLDNIEQALPAVGPLVTELLAACPEVTLLVTSRTPLWIRGEYIFPIPPLALPATSEATTAATVAASPAVRLFLQRAEAAPTHLMVTPDNAAMIAEIVRRLDGLPLAIELAAARTRAFSLPAMLDRLDSRLAFLTGGPRDLPARQQTLRTAIAWSYNLLPAEERRLFSQLAVFAEGFTAEAATWVTDVEAPSPSSATQVRLAALLDWSLLTRTGQADGMVRFGMLETIHEFAREQLEAAGEMTALRQRHLQWCLSFAELAVAKLNTAEEPAWLPRLRQEDANLQAALAWAFESGHDADLELGLQLAGSLAMYWLRCGRPSEARGWLTRAINASANRAPSAGQARVQAGAVLIEQAQEAVE
jgi:predicted ATPase